MTTRCMTLDHDTDMGTSDCLAPGGYVELTVSGEVRFIRSVAEGIKNEQGAPVRFVGTDQEITDQVKATELLRESEARLKSAERMTHVGNWIWDIKANRVSWSEEMLRILGQPRDYEPSYEESLRVIVSQDRGNRRDAGSG